jgi:hypothetical protein
MSIIALLLLVALMIPIMGIVFDSPIGRALARRLEGPSQELLGVAELAKKVDLLGATVTTCRARCRSSRRRTSFSSD